MEMLFCMQANTSLKHIDAACDSYSLYALQVRMTQAGKQGQGCRLQGLKLR